MRTHGTVQKGSDIPDTKSDIPDIKSDTDRTKHRTLPDTQTGHAPDIHRTSPDITGHTGHPVTQGSASWARASALWAAFIRVERSEGKTAPTGPEAAAGVPGLGGSVPARERRGEAVREASADSR